MATALPPPLTSSTATTNGTKLRRLLIDGGTSVLKKIFDDKHPPSRLADNLYANYSTLENLLHRRILSESQWKQLFPSDSLPNSGTFDITLLFLLLTEICGLDPPKRTGWNNKPHSKDKSLSAKLVRIKLFRNKLFHLPETRIDTETFVDLWKELSGVLCSLGFNHLEVEKLKVENCGEDDYLDILFKWVDWEKDVKGKLEVVHQTQTKTHEIVKELHKTRLQDHQTIQDSKSKLDEVQQTQTKIHDVLEDVHQTRLQDHQAIQNSKSKLDEVHQTQTKTHEVVEEVYQTRLQDHRTIQDSKSKLDEVIQSQAKIHEVVEEVRQKVEKVESLKEQQNSDRKDEVLRNLAKSEFKGEIAHHYELYEGNTREWVFERVQNWLDDRSSHNRVLVISGNAGMGKSVIAAVISKKMQEAGRLAGSHFCQHNNARYRNPRLMLQSLAYHLSHALPDYKHALVKQLSRNLGKDLNNMGVEELFSLLFKEPLSTVTDPCTNMLMVIDGLDESEYQERSKLLDVISGQFCKLPVWIRFLVTTRPEMKITEKLKLLKPFKLESDDEMNLEDIRTFFERKLRHVIKPVNKDAIVKRLVLKSEGLMLHASFLVSFIEDNKLDLDQLHLDDSLPLGICSIYASYFKRLENELIKELGVKEEHFLNLLCAVTASREPLPVDLVSKVLVPSNNSLLVRRKVSKAIGSLSSLLPIRQDCLHVFHKSVIDWLTDESCYGKHEFLVVKNEGHCILANLCVEELDRLKQKGVHNAQFSSTEKYALHHGVRHMLLLNENRTTHKLEELTQKYVIDLELLYAKLCLNSSTAAEDLVWFQKQEISAVSSKESQTSLNTVLALLRKHHERFTTHSNVFFQTILNEGDNSLSPKIAELLQNKYPEIPYMEYIHKETQEGSFEATFRCSSEVACFDISPHHDYMVCECSDQTIHLWSLHTGNLLWRRPVKVEKCYKDEREPFRVSSSSSVFSCYRSVVFHPAKCVVLPGILSDVYTFSRELEPLFPQSSCSFSVCSISGDKAKMLTDFSGNTKCLILWSLIDGSEITRTIRDEAILSFAWSPDGRLLAISHISGLVCLVDVKNSFGRLAQVTIPKACGMIKFSPDLQFIYCWHKPIQERPQGQLLESGPKGFRLNVSESHSGTFSLDIFPDNVDYEPCVYGLSSKGGFLMGDRVSCLFKKFQTFSGEFLWCLVEGTFAFVVDKQTVIRVFPGRSIIVMSIPDKLKSMREASHAKLRNAAFSLDAETVYGVTDRTEPTVISMDVSSRELKAEIKMVRHLHHTGINWRICVVPVREGVLLNPSGSAVELWNFELSACVRSWSNLREVTHMMAISEERVACVGRDFEVHILDTTSEVIVKSIPLCHEGYQSTYTMLNREAIVCNRKYQLLSTDRGSVQLADDTSIRWKRPWEESLLYSYNLPGMFSPAEEFVIISAKTSKDEQDVYVLDASSGNTLRTLCRDKYFFNCAFVSNEECVIGCQSISEVFCFRLFNVRSGHLLSVIDMNIMLPCLASCLRKCLIAVGLWNSHRVCAFIQVKLPRDKDRLESKRWELSM